MRGFEVFQISRKAENVLTFEIFQISLKVENKVLRLIIIKNAPVVRKST